MRNNNNGKNLKLLKYIVVSVIAIIFSFLIISLFIDYIISNGIFGWQVIDTHIIKRCRFVFNICLGIIIIIVLVNFTYKRYQKKYMQNNFFFKKHKSFIKFLKNEGWNEKINICDYWFNNKTMLLSKLYKKYHIYGENTGYLNEVETRIRWESELGKLFLNEIKSHIIAKQKLPRKLNVDLIKFNDFSRKIDLSDVSVEYNGKLIFINDFCMEFKTNSTIHGQIDLRGIPLNGFEIDNVTLSDLNFTYSDFSNAHIQQCTFNNINFGKCDMHNSYISFAIIDEHTHFSGSDFSNSYIHIAPSKSNSQRKNIGGFTFNKIKYLQLIRLVILRVIFNKKNKYKCNFTFFNVDEVLFYSEKQETVKYLLWFKTVQKRILEKSQYSCMANFLFFCEVVITKYWSSFISVAFFSCVAILTYAIPYSRFIISDEVRLTYFDAIYYSINCFTGLGTSDVILETNMLRMISLTESILGYIVLVVFVYLLGQKLNRKY